MQLAERCRPTTLESVIGQTAAVTRIERLRRSGLGGRSWWIAGLSGTGKTTLGRIIAREVAGDWFDELDASDCTPKSLKEWEQKLRCRPLDGKGWALVINEAHGLRKDAVKQLLVLLERLPQYAVVVFTTTNAGQQSLFEDCIDAGPLMSRCTVLQLESRGKDLELTFACHLRNVARREQLDGGTLDRYVNLVRTKAFNLRACLQEIECGVMCD